MRRLFCDPLPTETKTAPLSDDEALHALSVLRLTDGTRVFAIDGKGKEVEALIRVQKKRASLEWVGSSRSEPKPSEPRITLEAAILKGDSMSWLIEKAVEIGIHRFQPIESGHVVLRMKDKGPEAYRERWQRIADQALKQCGRIWKMDVLQPVSIQALFSNPLATRAKRFVFDEVMSTHGRSNVFSKALKDHPVGHLTEIHLLVGPEGGWSAEDRGLWNRVPNPEIQAVGLGPAILRAETASLVAASQLTGVLDCLP